MNTQLMSWWFRNEATCCDTHGPCNQGRDCPERQPQPAEACTEVGADSPPMSRASAWTMLALIAAPWLVIIGIGIWSAL